MLFYILFVTLFIGSSCLASRLPLLPKELSKKESVATSTLFEPLEPDESIESLGEAIAYVGLDIASCIGRLKPLECLSNVIQQANISIDTILADLLTRPALLYTHKDDDYDDCIPCNPFKKSTITKRSIARWLIDYPKLSTSFYDLFSIFDSSGTTPLISHSKVSFELRAIFDVVGAVVRADPHLTKIMGIAQAVLKFVKLQNGNLSKNHRIRMKQVDSIVACLGGDFGNSKANDSSLDEELEDNLNKIRSKSWTNLRQYFQNMKCMHNEWQISEFAINIRRPYQVQNWRIVKLVVDQYPIDHWQNSLYNWVFEKVIFIPNLVNYLNDQLIRSAQAHQDVMMGPHEEDNIIVSIKCECINRGLSLIRVAKILYSHQLGNEKFTEFLTLAHHPTLSCDFELESNMMRDILLHSSLLYAIPNKAEQLWLWEVLRRKHLLEDNIDKYNRVDDDEAKQNGEVINAPLTNRAKIYQQVTKAYEQKPDINLLSFLDLIDKGCIEVISNLANPRTPLLDINWTTLDFKKSQILEQPIMEAYNPLPSQLNHEDNAQTEKVDPHTRISTTNDQHSKPKAKAKDAYKVFILRRGLIHEISKEFRHSLKLMSGDLLLISSSLKTQQLEEICRSLRFTEENNKVMMMTNNNLLNYMLLATNTIAVRIL